MPARTWPPEASKSPDLKGRAGLQCGLSAFCGIKKAWKTGPFQPHVEKAPIYCVFRRITPCILQEMP
jgi:hypothetical protein